MAQTHLEPSGSAMTDYVSDGIPLQSSPTRQQPVLPVLSANQYSDSLAYWHIPHPQYPGPSISASQPYDTPRQPFSHSAPEHKKHKRTRSGCFTCRARRIKCDETRPVCERCKKGNRDCVYPTSPSATHSQKAGARKTKSGAPRRASSQDSDSSDHGDGSTGLDTIVDQQEEGTEGDDGTSSMQRHSPPDVPNKAKPSLRKSQSSHSVGMRQTRRPPDSARAGDSSSPSADSSTQVDSFSSQSPAFASSGLDMRNPAAFAHLSEKVRFYLKFHQESISHHHFFLKSSADRFIHQTMVELALRYEPLLYAMVGFAAYLHSMREQSAKLSTFLKFYSKALTLLRKSLSAGEPHTEATLLTVLVLTTFEEYIGDLTSMIDHHQAANALVLELLTPDSISLSDLNEHLFIWYARFDVVVGILAGHETVLSRDWYMAKEVYDRERVAMYPDDLDKQIRLACSLNRRSGLDLASLCAKVSHGMISLDEFETRSDHLYQTLETMKGMLLKYSGSEHTVLEFPNKQPLTEDDIVDPYVPGSIHQGPLWELNFVWIDLMSTIMMFKWQRLMILQKTPLSELQDLSMELCRMMETIDRWPTVKEPGYRIGFKNALGFACIFIPQTERCIMWCRRNLVRLEQNGYIYAPKFRAQLAAAWNMPELNHWWLPNDEGYPQVAREIRAMIEERSKVPRDGLREGVRDLKTLFHKMTLDVDTTSEGSPNSSRSGNV